MVGRLSTPCEPAITTAHGAVYLDIRRGRQGTELTVRLREARITPVATFAAVLVLAYAWVAWAPEQSLYLLGRGNQGFVSHSSEPAAAQNGKASMFPCMLLPALLAVALLVLICELGRVTRESVRILPGGVGYVLESARRCGAVRRRFIDSRDVEYVTLSEAITSSNVHFFLALALRPDAAWGGEGLAVPYQNLLPHVRLRLLKAVYRELLASRQPQQPS